MSLIRMFKFRNIPLLRIALLIGSCFILSHFQLVDDIKILIWMVIGLVITIQTSITCFNIYYLVALILLVGNVYIKVFPDWILLPLARIEGIFLVGAFFLGEQIGALINKYIARQL